MQKTIEWIVAFVTVNNHKLINAQTITNYSILNYDFIY